MGSTFSRVKTWSSGETLTAADLNAEFDNILNNLDPDGVDDASASASAMQDAADPYPASTASLATSLTGELKRLRYLLAQITGETYWYIDPDNDIATLHSTVNTIVANYLKGDGTAERVLRRSKLVITDATDANEIQCTLSSEWNGDAISAVDNIGKGETVGGFTLNAGGNGLTIEASGLTGNAVAVISAEIGRTQASDPVNVAGTVSSNDIVLTFYDDSTGAAQDLTSKVDTGDLDLYITYLTSA